MDDLIEYTSFKPAKENDKVTRKASCLLILILISACVPRQPYTMQRTFIESEYQNYTEEGKSVIKGQAFGKTRGGDVKYGAGSTVILFPRTAYTEEMVIANAQVGKISNIDHRITKYSKKTIADGNGRFEFTNIPNGEYIVWSEVWWEVFNGHYMERTGGDVIATLSIKKEDTYNVVVTR